MTASDAKSPRSPATASPVSSRPLPRRTISYPYDPRNRIDVICRLCSLQQSDGRWDYSLELADLVKMWGGRELMSPAHGVTALAHACLLDLCNHVWAAQREGSEHASLSAAELISLQTLNWDLSWAKIAIDQATAWMNGYR